MPINISFDAVMGLIERILSEASNCTTALFVGAIVSLFVPRPTLTEVHQLFSYVSIALIVLGVVSHIINGFAPKFCMNRAERSISKDIERAITNG